MVTNAIDHAVPPLRCGCPSTTETLAHRARRRQPGAAGGACAASRCRSAAEGMFLVDRLSAAWGVLPWDSGKTVWAEFGSYASARVTSIPCRYGCRPKLVLDSNPGLLDTGTVSLFVVLAVVAVGFTSGVLSGMFGVGARCSRLRESGCSVRRRSRRSVRRFPRSCLAHCRAAMALQPGAHGRVVGGTHQRTPRRRIRGAGCRGLGPRQRPLPDAADRADAVVERTRQRAWRGSVSRRRCPFRWAARPTQKGSSSSTRPRASSRPRQTSTRGRRCPWSR